MKKPKRLEAWLERPLVEAAKEILDGTIGDFVRHDAHVYAAAVAFYASVSLFPFLLLAISLAGTVLAWTTHGADAESSAAFADFMTFLHAAVPYLGPDFEGTLLNLIERRASLGAAGGLALLTTSSMVFRSLEFSLARVFSWREKERPRNVIISKILFGAFVMSVVIVFLGARYLMGALRGVVGRVDATVVQSIGLSFIGDEGLLRSLIWDLVVIIGFVVVLNFFCRSRTRPRWIYSFLGGALFLLLWAAAGWGFDLYVGRFASLPQTYGPWAALVVVQLWIFYSAVVFMIAAEFVKTLDRRHAFAQEADSEATGAKGLASAQEAADGTAQK